MNKVVKILPLGLLLPSLALAQDLGYFTTIVEELAEIIELLVPVVIGLALVVFIWGLVTFILASGDEGSQAEGKRRMIWGVIALFVIVAIWGIVALLGDITGVETEDVDQPAPNVPD